MTLQTRTRSDGTVKACSSAPLQKEELTGLCEAAASVPIPVAKGRQEFVVFLSFRSSLIIQGLENLNLPAQGQASNFLIAE